VRIKICECPFLRVRVKKRVTCASGIDIMKYECEDAICRRVQEMNLTKKMPDRERDDEI